MLIKKTTLQQYDKKYSKGLGWKYSKWRERRMFKKFIINPLGIKRGLRVLEIGCGMGFHSNILSKLGFNVVGVDLSEYAANYAKEHYPKTIFHHMDVRDLSSVFKPESFDWIFARSFSWFHYRLDKTGLVDVTTVHGGTL